MAAYRLTDGLSSRTAAVSEAAARHFTQQKAAPPRKCAVILNGIEVETFVHDGEQRARMRAEMGVGAANASFVWLAVGRVVPAKDYPNLIRAFAQVRERRPDARLWVAGEQRTGEFAALDVLLKDLGVEAHVLLLGLRRDIPALLDAADAFVSGSVWEGMPLAVGEAMAMEKPVVATDAGGVRELIGDAGVVVPAKNPTALAEAMIATMQQSGEERDRLGRAARERVVRHFSMDATADTWEALYRKLMSLRGGQNWKAVWK